MEAIVFSLCRAHGRPDAAPFLQDRIATAPDFLRLPLRIALTSVEWSALPWGGRFSRLSEERQKRWLAILSRVPFPPLQDLFRLFDALSLYRSCT